jgi:hypothetical protein
MIALAKMCIVHAFQNWLIGGVAQERSRFPDPQSSLILPLPVRLHHPLVLFILHLTHPAQGPSGSLRVHDLHISRRIASLMNSMKSKYFWLSAQICLISLVGFAIHEALNKALPNHSKVLDLLPL